MNSAPQPTDDDREEKVNYQRQSLKQSVTEAMQRYFSDLDGQATHDLYSIVMAEVEPPLLKAVMAYTRQNQSRAAETLGLNRGTLRKKLKKYDLL